MGSFLYPILSGPAPCGATIVVSKGLPPSSAFPLNRQRGSSLRAPPTLMRETPSLLWQSFIRCHCHITSVQSLSHVQLFATLGTAANQASLNHQLLGAYSWSSSPLSQWCHPTISSSVIPFSSCLKSFPASGSFQMSQLFTSGGQSIGVSTSTSVLPKNI